MVMFIQLKSNNINICVTDIYLQRSPQKIYLVFPETKL